MQTLDYGLLPDLLGYQLRRAQVRLFQHFAATVGERAITPGQLGILVLIQRNPGLSQSALARALGVERSTLGEVVERFEKRGLISRQPSPSDRRSLALHLSPAGEALMAELTPLVRDHEKRFTAALSPAEREQLVGLLARLAP